MAEQRARKGKKTFDPLHKELSKVLFRPTKKYQKNQPLIGKVEIINPAEIFKKSIVKTSAPIKGLSRANPDVLSRDLRAKKQNIESQRKYEALMPLISCFFPIHQEKMLHQHKRPMPLMF